ncbi:hypothetical protein K8942_00710 [Candidatus Peribacteria bacterium]|nr:MAG: hypothetical protein K8942_00710 [Candidatus Peribacteria bacterium]
MALTHIRQAITSEADATIKRLAADHAAAVQSLNDAHKQSLQALRTSLLQQKTQKLHQMRSRAEGHAGMLTRHAVLQRKQEILNDLYTSVAESLAKQPEADLEKMLRNWIDTLPEGGTILPAKPHAALLKKLCGSKYELGDPILATGGFRYVGKKENRDCTFEFIVQEVLRPETEISIAAQLFA